MLSFKLSSSHPIPLHPALWCRDRDSANHISLLMAWCLLGAIRGGLERWRRRKGCVSPVVAWSFSLYHLTWFFIAATLGLVSCFFPHSLGQPHHSPSKILAATDSSPTSETRSQLYRAPSPKIPSSKTPNYAFVAPGTGSNFLCILVLCHLSLLLPPKSLNTYLTHSLS